MDVFPKVTILGNEVAHGLLAVYGAEEDINSYLLAIPALETCEIHVPRLSTNASYLNLSQARFLRTSHEHVVSLGVAIRELRVEPALQ
jgi:hypothetical protein